MEEGPAPGFLPPKAAGPEPELGPAPERAVSHGYLPPAGATPAEPGQAAGPWAPRAEEPDNGPAVAGFVLSLVAGSLLLLTLGVSSAVSAGLAIGGLVYSRAGRRKVASGETLRHEGLAQAGFVIGIVSLVLAVLATLALGAVVLFG